MSPGATPGHRVKAAERGGGVGGQGKEGMKTEGGGRDGGALAPSRCHTADDTLIPFPPLNTQNTHLLCPVTHYHLFRSLRCTAAL